MTCMVSVIVLTYNHEKYIERALQSIINQKVNFEYEILIGNDNSTDNTINILKTYTDKYPIIKVFNNQTNLGVTRNAYNLFIKAKGKYLASCEGDDYWSDDNKLQKQIDFLEKNNRYVGCSHLTKVVNENDQEIGHNIPWVKRKKVYTNKDYDGFHLPGHSSSIVRKNIFLNNNKDYSIFYKISPKIGDRTSILMCLEYGSFYQIKKYMSCYRIHEKNITFNLNKDWIKDEYQITESINQFAINNNIKIDCSYYYAQLTSKSIINRLYYKHNDEMPIYSFYKKANNKIKYCISLPILITKDLFSILLNKNIYNRKNR